MGIFKSLNREQKEAVGLLQIGTFLEYFDLDLYVNMEVLLDAIFFPKTDPHTAALLSAFAFCSTFVMRPFGALLFGYIGDNIGRKTTVIITTLMMSVSCVVMANLPTYVQIGIAATWTVTICRIVQGLSSMGEVMGAMVYMTEITKPPAQYPAVAFINVAAALGSVAALGVATLVTTVGFNWRIAFWVGAGIAVVGSIARTRLRETPEFIDSFERRRNKIKNNKKHNENDAAKTTEDTILKRNNHLAFFLLHCGWPLSLYLCYMYFNPILKQDYGYSTEDIIHHNFLLSLIQFSTWLFLAVLSFRIHPLKIMKTIGVVFLFITIFLPFLIAYRTNHFYLFALQAMLMIFSIVSFPGVPIFIKNFPVLKRVMATSVLYSLSRAVVYVFTSFGLVYLSEVFGHYGLWIVMLPITIGFLWGVKHFEVVEGICTPKISSLFGFKYAPVEVLPNPQQESKVVEDKKFA